MRPDRGTAVADGGSGDATLASLERGLDALERSAVQETPRWRRWTGKVGPPLLAVALVLLVWQVLIWMEIKPRYTFPSPGTSGRRWWTSGARARCRRRSG